jgi:hypothetical protein
VQRHIDTAYSKAYEELVAALKDQQGWGEALAQFRESRKTIVTGLESIAASALAVKKGKFLKAVQILGFTKPTKGMSNARKHSGDWLAWTYAVSPTIKDVQSAVKTLVKTDFGSRRLIGKSGSSIQTASYVSERTASGDSSWWTSAKESLDVFVAVRHGLTARIENPNMFLATTSGFATPTLPWDLVPFSFVGDWFGNLGVVLGSLSAFAGVSIEGPYSTTFARGVKLRYTVDGAAYTGVPSASWQTTSNTKFEGVSCSRTLGVPQPSFVIYPFEGLSWQRGLNAIALIVSVFGN